MFIRWSGIVDYYVRRVPVGELVMSLLARAQRSLSSSLWSRRSTHMAPATEQRL
jgi:hypothetical protein